MGHLFTHGCLRFIGHHLNMQITDKKVEDAIVPVFRLAFRPFFLGGVLFSIIAMLVWGGLLSGAVPLALYSTPFWWHAHEMLFGFGGAIIIGFLLTAVQNWTGLPGLRSWSLVLLFIFWLVPRVAMLLSSSPQVWIALLDLLWLPLAAYVLGRPVVLVKGWRNLFFVPLLLLMTILNGQMHYAAYQNDYGAAMQAAYSTVLTITALMLVMGGRVIPFFTSRRLGFTQPVRYRWLEIMSLLPFWLIVLASVLQISAPDFVYGGLLLTTFIFNLIRFCRWKPQQTLGVPLLWSLHLSYLLILIGLINLAWSYIAGFDNVLAIHFLTIGGMGSLILAMICRVTLGHTGRNLELPGKFMAVALSFPAISVLFRSVMPELVPEGLSDWYLISIAFWIAAYGAYLYYYAAMLMSPRADNRPG